MSDYWLILIVAISGIIGYLLLRLIDKLFGRHGRSGKRKRRERKK